jgi:hypothetical protein
MKVSAIDNETSDDVEFVPTSMYNRRDIGLMLYADHLARKHHDWPLVGTEHILMLNQSIIAAAHDYQSLFDTTNMLTINNQHDISQLRDPEEVFSEFFPFIQPILNAFQGKVIVAGGSIYKAFQSCENSINPTTGRVIHRSELLGDCDVDLFFINCTLQEVDEIIKFAVGLIQKPRQHLKYLSGQIKEDVNDGVYDDVAICIDRCQNSTTLYYACNMDGGGEGPEFLNDLAEYHWHDGGGKIQFIHRVYPSAASVIGAFDLGPCMGLYDGIEFLATPFGAWSISTQTVILDVSRRSTSFEHRIVKYITRGRCRLLIVNGSNAEMYQRLATSYELSNKTCRYFYPVKGLKAISWHVPNGKYEGLEERVAARKEIGKAWIPDGKSVTLVSHLNSDHYSDGEEYDEEVNKLRELDDNPDYQDYIQLQNKQAEEERIKRSLNRFEIRSYGRGVNSDYDAGDFNEYSVAEANGIFASQGKIDNITWRSATIEAAFENPEIRYKLHEELEEKFEVPRRMQLDLLHRWFTLEEIGYIQRGKVKSGNYVKLQGGHYRYYAAEVRNRVVQNIARAKEKAARGVTILTENPGRQWTSSRNPVVSDVRDYYDRRLLSESGPLVIGIPHEVFALLRLAQMQSDSVWRWLPKDVFKLIMATLARLLSEDGTKILSGFMPNREVQICE